MMTDEASLGQLIWLVRRELEWAHQIDIDHPLRFDVGSIELDVVVEVARTTSGGGGLDLKVLGVGGSGQVSREKSEGSTTTVHVVLTPRITGSPGVKYDVSALDTEPPPRRAEVTGTGDAPPDFSGAADTDGFQRGARDIEPPPDRRDSDLEHG